jgi:hypothetical protein
MLGRAALLHPAPDGAGHPFAAVAENADFSVPERLIIRVASRLMNEYVFFESHRTDDDDRSNKTRWGDESNVLPAYKLV